MIRPPRTLPPRLGALFLGAMLVASRRALGEPTPVSWRAVTQSPHTASHDARLAPLLATCGMPDAALLAVAGHTARRQADGGGLPRSEELAFDLRAAGEPHVWPRAWSIVGGTLEDDDVARRIRSWIAPWNTLGVRRCGVARLSSADGNAVVAVVAVDVLADLSPLPTTARVGQWLTLDATMRVPATGAQVVLLGPRGAPKTVPASLSGERVRSSFSVDQPGGWMVQVLATVSTGPRPVLEAMVYAGVTPPSHFTSVPAPGESAAQGVKDDDEAMLQMINAARASEQLAMLVRDPALDKVARAHSEEMLRTRQIGHDVGTGDPSVRLRAAGVNAHVAGENVATAASLSNAHRALWASPSHRGNLLFDRFSRVGVAVIRSADGTVWVTEMFAG